MVSRNEVLVILQVHCRVKARWRYANHCAYTMQELVRSLTGQRVNAPSRPSGRVSRAEQVAADVELEFLSAGLPVGHHLGRRAEFMERFSISPTIMNETLRILRDRGLITVRPGHKGGIFVAGVPPQVRLGGMDLWFRPSASHPLDLFEARVTLESSLNAVAFDRATATDVELMDAAVRRLVVAEDASASLAGAMELHRVLVGAAKIPVLDGMHQCIVATLQATLSRVEYIDGGEDLVRRSQVVHAEMVRAIAVQDRTAFERASALHDADLISAGDPRRSPLPELEARRHRSGRFEPGGPTGHPTRDPAP